MLIIADDGSTDETVSLIQDLDLANVRLLIADKNGGKGRAVQRGMLAARGRYILFDDADNSTPIEELDRVLKELKEGGYDVAVGSRAADGSKETNKSFVRHLMSGTLRWIVRNIFNLEVRDTQCGFKLFTRRAAHHLFEQQTIMGFSFDLEIIYLADKFGYGLAEAWLAAKAIGFSVWEDSVLVAKWPVESDCLNSVDILRAPITYNGEMLGELAVNGLSDENSQMRLNTQADLVVELLRLAEQIVGLEEDLDTMTADFVETQDQLLALTSLSRSTRHSMDIGETLGLLLQESICLIRVEGGFITINSGNQPVLVDQEPGQLYSQADLQVFFEDTRRANGELLLSGNDPFLAKLPDTLSATALLVQTIPIQNNMTIMMGFLLNQPTSKISPSIKLARGIAEYAGAQLENILLYQENLAQAKLKAELDLASKIQLQLLPHKAPVVAGLDIAAASKPALQVGGDYYDFLPSLDDTFIFAVGDVSGKGMSAAMVMTMLRTTMRGTTGANPTTTTPARRLQICNQIMYEDLTDLGMFCTLFVAQYDSVQQQVTYANAGHSPVIYCPRGGAATILQPDAPPVGILLTSLSEDFSLSFKPGDLLVVVTDGVNEARNTAGAMFSYERLLQLIEANVDKSAKDILEILFDAVEAFRGEHPPDDDQTLIVIKVGGHEL